VYFVSTRQVTDLKWGTPSPVMMRDADFGPVRVRGFGTYTLRAKDAKRLLGELVGTDSAFEADEIHELVRAIVSQAFADVVGKSEVALLDLASHYAELSEEVRRVAEGRIDDEYGLEIPQLVFVNVSVPAEVEQALDARTSVGVIGDLHAFQSYQLSRSLPAAAANPAGGLAGAGVGVGMGMALAGRFAEGAGPGSVPPLPAPVAWHFVEAGRSVGPVPAEELARAASQGRLTPDTLVWSAGMRDWLPARSVPALAPLFGGSTPPPIPSR
jgi:membrane protease subunit (stomatin/prohibitin family)